MNTHQPDSDLQKGIFFLEGNLCKCNTPGDTEETHRTTIHQNSIRQTNYLIIVFNHWIKVPAGRRKAKGKWSWEEPTETEMDQSEQTAKRQRSKKNQSAGRRAKVPRRLRTATGVTPFSLMQFALLL